MTAWAQAAEGPAPLRPCVRAQLAPGALRSEFTEHTHREAGRRGRNTRPPFVSMPISARPFPSSLLGEQTTRQDLFTENKAEQTGTRIHVPRSSAATNVLEETEQ